MLVKQISDCHAHKLTFGLVDNLSNQRDIRQGANDDQTDTDSDARPTLSIHRSVRNVSLAAQNYACSYCLSSLSKADTTYSELLSATR
jgi:hypothetical protein